MPNFKDRNIMDEKELQIKLLVLGNTKILNLKLGWNKHKNFNIKAIYVFVY